MNKRQIRLTVTFKAEYEGMDMEMLEQAPDMVAEETVSLVMPQMEDKYVVLPKVLEGVTCGVIAKHQSLVSEYYDRKRAEEKAEKERAKMLPFPSVANGRG